MTDMIFIMADMIFIMADMSKAFSFHKVAYTSAKRVNLPTIKARLKNADSENQLYLYAALSCKA